MRTWRTNCRQRLTDSDPSRRGTARSDARILVRPGTRRPQLCKGRGMRDTWIRPLDARIDASMDTSMPAVALSHSHHSHRSPQPMNGEQGSHVAHAFPSASCASGSSAPMHCTQRRAHSSAAGCAQTISAEGRGGSDTGELGKRIKWMHGWMDVNYTNPYP